MQCPVCSVPLNMSERQGVEIDYCPQCRGVWLDRGELDKIIEQSHGVGAPTPRHVERPARTPQGFRTPEYRDGSYDDREHYRPKKRKNWLEEIFD